MFRGTVSFLAMILATAANAAEAPNPAHTIAQKFAAPTETAAPAAAKSERPKAQPVAKAGPAKTEPANPAPVKVEAAKAEASKTERPPLDYEMEMLRQARAEQAAVKAAKSVQPPASSVATTATVSPAPAPAASTSAITETPSPVTTTKPVAAVVPAPLPPAAPAATQPVAAVTAVTATATAVAAPAAATAPIAAPAKTAEATPAPAAAVPATAPATPAKAVVEPTKAPAAVSGPTAPATLLLALETSGASAKGTSAAASFDPIVCLNETCFVSGGLQADAIKIAKSDAIKLKTSEEASAASCKGMIACVYRNVAVPAGAQFQLIELGSATHDSARAADLKIDATCKVTEGELGCDEPIATPNFKVWVVPEETAKTAGVQAIEEAVADGLPHVDVARTTDK